MGKPSVWAPLDCVSDIDHVEDDSVAEESMVALMSDTADNDDDDDDDEHDVKDDRDGCR